MRADPLLDDLDPRQRAAVTAPDMPLAIIAPAGSGKTRVLTRRIAFRIREGAADASHVLALTFTRKAAGELVERLGPRDGLTAGTFHAIALAQLRRQAAVRGREPPQVLDRKARIVAPLIGGRGAAAPGLVNDVVAEIDWAKARLVAPDEYAAAAHAAGRHAARPASEIADIYQRYEYEKRTRRVLDFDDVLGRCAEAIERDPEFAAAQRYRFRHLFVDEFQDATPRQLRLLRAWLGDRDDLAVVGDPAQAIYGFAGADASPLHDFGLVFPGGTTVSLVRNYRSSRAVVGLAEAALGPEAAATRERPEAVRGDGAAPTIVAYDDDHAEAEAVADGCRRAFRAGVPWRDIAVLFRTNAQCARFEAALAGRLVPCRVTESGRFATRPGGRALVDRLRKAEHEAPERPLAHHVADLAADDTPADDDLRADRETLLELSREYLAAEGGAGDVAGLVAWVDAALRPRRAEVDAVDLATFHRAKGLEWSVVFVTGLERGLVPISWATGVPVALAEERRLLHVAFSRAGDELHCSWARARTVGARRSAREPSPWLSGLEHAARDLAVPTPSLSERMEAMRDALDTANVPVPRRRTR